MIPSSLFNIYGLLILFAVLIALIKANKSYIKGWFGEFMVNQSARLMLDKEIYHLIKNVTIPTEDGGTTQIDHIIVSKYGIFVIETKNMKGWIFGSERDKTWTQQIYKHKTRFQNPLLQNYKHTRTLEDALGLLPNKIFSLIVFTGKPTFKTDMPEHVTYLDGYIDYIKSKTEPLFGEFEVCELVNKIGKIRHTPNLQTHRKHVEYLRNKHSDSTYHEPEPTNQLADSPKAHPALRVINAALFVIAFLVLVVIARNYIDGKQHNRLKAITKSQEPEVADQPKNRSYQTTKDGNKQKDQIYQWKDDQGKTRYTNVGVPDNGQLIKDESEKAKTSIPIEISDGKVYVSVTVGNKGTQLETSLLIDLNCNKTVLPTRVADFVKSDDMRAAGFAKINGELYPGETRRVSYFNIGSIVENDFIFLASDIPQSDKRGILGMDFMIKHPFQIDTENKCLNWL